MFMQDPREEVTESALVEDTCDPFYDQASSLIDFLTQRGNISACAQRKETVEEFVREELGDLWQLVRPAPIPARE